MNGARTQGSWESHGVRPAAEPHVNSAVDTSAVLVCTLAATVADMTTIDPAIRKELDRLASNCHDALQNVRKVAERAAAETGYAAQFPNDQKAQKVAEAAPAQLRAAVDAACAALARTEAAAGETVARLWPSRSEAAKVAGATAKSIGAHLGRISQELRQHAAAAGSARDLRTRAGVCDKVTDAATRALKVIPTAVTVHQPR